MPESKKPNVEVAIAPPVGGAGARSATEGVPPAPLRAIPRLVR